MVAVLVVLVLLAVLLALLLAVLLALLVALPGDTAARNKGLPHEGIRRVNEWMSTHCRVSLEYDGYILAVFSSINIYNIFIIFIIFNSLRGDY
jgi:hypothetical protein